MSHSAQSQFGSDAGNYQILGEVGAGGMGKVLKAFDVRLRRTVALKFLSATEGTADRERVLREARAASTLDHKNIATIHAVEESGDGQLFIVMPYYDGESLAARIRRGGVSKQDAIDIVFQVAHGLAHAHAHHIIHRDIKPSNVIITVDGVAKIVDFGLAKSVGAQDSTQTMNIGGTLPYMSPEQVSGKPVDARSDIWSLGVLIYELLSGKLPFQGDSAASIITAILQSPPVEMGALPLELQSIVYKALAKRPESRYQSCGEILRDLEAVQAAEASTTSWSTKRAVKQRRSLASSANTDHVKHPWRALGWVTATVLAALIAVSYLRERTGFVPGTPGEATDKVSSTDRGSNRAAYESYLQGISFLRRYDRPSNVDKAIEVLERTVQTDPKFALAYVALAEAYWDKYRLDQDARWFDKASSYCQRAAELNSNLPAVYVMLARIHNGAGQYDLALQEVQRALQLDGRNADALLVLADVYASTGRYEEAEENYQRAAASRPSDWDGRYRLAVFYYRQRRYADAAEQFRKVVAMIPDHAAAYANLGVMLRHMGQEREAEASFKKSISLNPSYPAFANLGDLYYRQGRYAESAEMTEKALRLNQEDYRVWTNLAIAYERMGRNRKAGQAYDSALAKLEAIEPLKAQDPAVQGELGLIYAKKHQAAKALPALEAAVALAPEDAEVWGEIAEGYESLGQRQKAIACIRQALARGWTLKDVELITGLHALLADPNARRQIQNPQAVKTGPTSPR